VIPMAVFTGRITKLEIGASAGSHTDVLNVKFMRWKRIHNVTPRLLPSSKIPVGWLQGHSHVEGELGVVSEMNTAIASYYGETVDSIIIPFVKVSYRKQDGAIATFILSGFIITLVEKALEKGSEAVFVYRFLAYNAVEG